MVGIYPNTLEMRIPLAAPIAWQVLARLAEFGYFFSINKIKLDEGGAINMREYLCVCFFGLFWKIPHGPGLK